MLRTRGLTLAGLMLSATAWLACGGGETAQQAGSGEAAAAETPAAQPMAEAEQQGEMQLPEGVTAEMVSQGKEIYGGAGLCHVCHGPEGGGMPGLGANLTDDEWLHIDGSFEGILQTVMNGVNASESSVGTAMPPKGGSGITDDQAKAVSAYVFTLSKGN
jgi:mono/diheme cytochrome c family protein